MPPPPWLALERMNQDHRGSSAGSWLHALEKVTNCCPLVVAGGSAKEQRGCGVGGQSPDTVGGAGHLQGDPTAHVPHSLPSKGRFHRTAGRSEEEKKKGRGRKVTREQT